MALSQALVERDLAALGRRFAICKDCGETPSAWAKHAACLPSDFARRITEDIAYPGRFAFCLRDNGEGKCTLKLYDNDIELAEICRTFRLEDAAGASVRHTWFEILSSYQGHAIATTILRNSFDVYRERNISKVTMSAGLAAGGYVWACFGFRPTDQAWGPLCDDIRDKIRTLDSPVPDHSAAVLQRALADDDPKAIWDIASLDHDLGRSDDGKPMRIGRFLLAGTHWDGEFDLEDVDARDQFETYVKRKLSGERA